MNYNFKIQIYVGLILINMILFSIWNIPLFKYLCDISYISYIPTNRISTCQYDFFFQKKECIWLFEEYKSFELCDITTNIIYLEQNSSYYSNYSSNYIYIDYSIQNEMNSFSQIPDSIVGSNEEIFKVSFKTTTSAPNLIYFLPLQKNIYVVPNETNLVFFRIYNPTYHQIKGLSIYIVYPNLFSIFLEKIQCFCFEEILLRAFEIIDLPVLFYINEEILTKMNTDIKKLVINYIFFIK